MKHNHLTKDELHNLLTYSPETGEFIWSATPRKGVRSGKPAGFKGAYHRIRIHRVEYKAHQLAWLYVYGRWPEGDVDHINGDTLDNRLCNLREGTRSQNLGNRGPQSNNALGIKGVSKIKGHELWRASLRGRHLGTFKSPESAAECYRAAAIEHYGEFASW